jgi:hypothetical protein
MSKKIIYSRALRTINAGYAFDKDVSKNLAIVQGLNSVDAEIIALLLKNKIFRAYIDSGVLIISDKLDALPLDIKANVAKDAKDKPKNIPNKSAAAEVGQPDAA